MARKKRLTPEQELQLYRDDLMEHMGHWGDLKLNGGHDPSWPDGTNMDLARKHIIWCRFEIMEVCIVNDLPYPPEYFLEVPPKAPKDYMASLDQMERVERLRGMGYGLTTEWGTG